MSYTSFTWAATSYTGHTEHKFTQKELNVLFTATQQCNYATTMLLCESTIGFMSTMCYSAQGYVLLTLFGDYIAKDCWETMQHCQHTWYSHWPWYHSILAVQTQ